MKLRVAASLRSGAHARAAGPSGLCSSVGVGAGRGGGGAALVSWYLAFLLSLFAHDLLAPSLIY